MQPVCNWSVYYVSNGALEFYTSLFVSDSETTEDEGEDQYETKDDVGDAEDQTARTGIHLISVQGDYVHNKGKVAEKTISSSSSQISKCHIIQVD